MVLDLTLDAIQIPNLPTYTPGFGTKKTVAGKGLSTVENMQNILSVYTRQRPYTIAEASSTGSVEANACIALATGCSAITLGDGAYTAVRVLLVKTTASFIQLITGQETGWIMPYQTIEVMWFGDFWYVLDGHMVGEILNVTFPLDKMPFGYLTLHSGLRPSRTAYKRLANTILFPLVDEPFTCTIATPSVFTKTAHGFVGGERLRLFTNGTLTGPTLSQDYFVERIDANTFYLNTLEGGTARLAITAQSGTHYYQCSAYGVGDGLTTMDLPDPRQSAFVGSGIGSTHPIAAVDTFLRGQWKDDQAQVITGTVPNLIAASAAGATGVFTKTYSAPNAADGSARQYVTVGINTALTNRTGTLNRNKDLGANFIMKY